MIATIRKLPSATAKPIIQTRDRNIIEMARLVAERAERRGIPCTFEDALMGCRAAIAKTRSLTPVS